MEVQYPDIYGKDVQSAYVSLSYKLPANYKISQDKVAFVLEPRTIKQAISADAILEKLMIPTLSQFSSGNSIPNTVSTDIYSVSNLIQVFFDSCSKAYRDEIRTGVISRVYFFYPWIRLYQNQQTYETTYFTVVEYGNQNRVFKVMKLISDLMDPLATIGDYLDETWNTVLPTIHINTEIYLYIPPDALPDYQKGVLSPTFPGYSFTYNSILGLFILTNFGLKLTLSNAEIAVVSRGDLSQADDLKVRNVAHKLSNKIVYVAVKPHLFDNYKTYCNAAFFHLCVMETYRDIIKFYRAEMGRKAPSESQLLKKATYENYLFSFAKKNNIKLDMDLQTLFWQNRRRSASSFLTDLMAKFGAELFTENLNM